jgi:hypothetical protein
MCLLRCEKKTFSVRQQSICFFSQNFFEAINRKVCMGSLWQPLKNAVAMNIHGTLSIIQLCNKLSSLAVSPVSFSYLSFKQFFYLIINLIQHFDEFLSASYIYLFWYVCIIFKTEDQDDESRLLWPGHDDGSIVNSDSQVTTFRF